MRQGKYTDLSKKNGVSHHLKKMELAVFTGQYFWYDGKNYSTDEAYLKFVASFSPYFEKIVICDAQKAGKETKAYVLDTANLEVCALPDYDLYSIWNNLLVVFPRIYRVIKDRIGDWGMVWLQAPHPVSLIFVFLCRMSKKPVCFFVRQNLEVYVGLRNRGVKKVLAVLAARVLERVFLALARKYPTFTVGGEIYRCYGKSHGRVHEIAVSLVSENDLNVDFPKRQWSEDRIKILNVGRLEPEKGVTYLIHAVNRLVEKGNTRISLEIVGDGRERERLAQEVRRMGLEKHINFHGYIRHGAELYSLYRGCHIYVQPSLTEGWPQTIFEAMAFGLPVVATRVGGIPYLIRDNDNGVIVEPRSPGQICGALERVIYNPEFRQGLIDGGLATVRGHTMEVERDRVIGYVEQYLDAGVMAHKSRVAKSSSKTAPVL